jgi:hypothetical protein
VPATARLRLLLLAGLAGLVALALLVAPGPVSAQEGEGGDQVPTQDIVPRPNSGEAPEEAGDRGGALQLLLPALIVAAIGGGVWHISRQARRAQPSEIARQAGSPSRKPLR